MNTFRNPENNNEERNHELQRKIAQTPLWMGVPWAASWAATDPHSSSGLASSRPAAWAAWYAQIPVDRFASLSQIHPKKTTTTELHDTH